MMPIDLHTTLKDLGAKHFKKQLYKERSTFQASLLSQCTKLFPAGKKESSVLLTDPNFVDYIKELTLG